MKNYKSMFYRLKYIKTLDKNTGKYKSKQRKLVNFDFDLRQSEKDFNANLSLSDKRKISKYHNIFFGDGNEKSQGLINDDVYLYRPRNEQNKKKALKYAGVKQNAPELLAIPIPRADKNIKPELKFSKNELIVTEGNIQREISYFNMMKLAENPDKEVKRALSQLKNKDAVQMLAGFREILGETYETEFGITEAVKTKMMRYSNYNKWLFGLVGYNFVDQSDFLEYKDERKKAKRKRVKKCSNCKKLLTPTEKSKRKCSKCGTRVK